MARGPQREDLGLARGETELLGDRGNTFILSLCRFFCIGLAGFHIELALFNWLKHERIVAIREHEARNNNQHHNRAYAERHHHRRECKSGDFTKRHASVNGAPPNSENQKRQSPRAKTATAI